jgi:hypothetical protein
MTDEDLDIDAPDAFTSEAECRARRDTRVIIGVDRHTHVCREIVDEESLHDGSHECTCGFQW